MTRPILLFFALLAGCSPEVRDIGLVDVNLRDMNAVATIRCQLEPQDSIAFANYVVRHHSAAERFCGQPLIGVGGREPVTVGEGSTFLFNATRQNGWLCLRRESPSIRSNS